MISRVEPMGLRFNEALVVTDNPLNLLNCSLRALTDDASLNDDEQTKVFERSRKRRHADRRHILMTLCLKYGTPVPITDIAKLFNRDHATLIHARHKCSLLIGTDRHFTRLWNQYEKHFKDGIK